MGWRTDVVCRVLVGSIALVVTSLVTSEAINANAGLSLEYLAAFSSSIGIYKVRSVSETKPKTESLVWKVSISTQRSKVLKGTPPDLLPFEFFIDDSRREETPRRKDEILVFFGAPFYGTQLSEPFAINLNKPSTGPTGEFVTPFDSDLQVIANRGSILHIVESSLTEREPSLCRQVIIEESPPEGSAIFDALFDMHEVSVLTPLVPRHESALLEHARTAQGRSRALAACLLQRCFNHTNMKNLLLDMLKDTGREEWWTGDSIYPARQFAYENLIELGVTVPKPRGVSQRFSGCVSCDHVRFVSLTWMAGSDLSDCNPEQLKDVKPVYPPSALKLGIEAEVFLSLNILKNGEVGDVSVEHVSVQRPPKDSEAALLQAARKWRFVPLHNGGKPIPMTVVVPVVEMMSHRMEVRTGFNRYWPATNQGPGTGLEMLNAEIPRQVSSSVVDDYSMVVDVSAAGNVLKARVPTLAAAAPLVEEAVRVAKSWMFQPLLSKDGADCSVSYRFEFKLPNPNYSGKEPHILVQRAEEDFRMGWPDWSLGTRQFGY